MSLCVAGLLVVCDQKDKLGRVSLLRSYSSISVQSTSLVLILLRPKAARAGAGFPDLGLQWGCAYRHSYF